MADASKVRGQRLFDLFTAVIKNRTIISINVVGADFDRLTCVTGLEESANGRYLIIDTPVGFRDAIRRKDPWHLRFNFNGPDKVEYIFSTQGGGFCSRGLKIPFPTMSNGFSAAAISVSKR